MILIATLAPYNNLINNISEMILYLNIPTMLEHRLDIVTLQIIGLDYYQRSNKLNKYNSFGLFSYKFDILVKFDLNY